METETIKNGASEIKNEVKNDLKKKVGMNPTREEGPIARAIESQTARIPSDAFLWASAGVMAASLTLKLLNKNHLALFIGQWAAPFLLFGIYNKIVKVHGHDKAEGAVGQQVPMG
jgi:hypothetical protein